MNDVLIFVYCMYECLDDVGSLGDGKFLRMWLTLKYEVFNSPLIFNWSTRILQFGCLMQRVRAF